MAEGRLANTTQATDANALTRAIQWREYWASNRAVGTREARDLCRFFGEDLGETRLFAECNRAVKRSLLQFDGGPG